jgi:hypothetical protein
MTIPIFDNTKTYSNLIQKGLKTSDYTTSVKDICEFIINEHSLLPHKFLTPNLLKIHIFEFLNQMPIRFVDEHCINHQISYLTVSMYVNQIDNFKPPEFYLPYAPYKRIDNIKIFNNHILGLLGKHIFSTNFFCTIEQKPFVDFIKMFIQKTKKIK